MRRAMSLRRHPVGRWAHLCPVPRARANTGSSAAAVDVDSLPIGNRLERPVRDSGSPEEPCHAPAPLRRGDYEGELHTLPVLFRLTETTQGSGGCSQWSGAHRACLHRVVEVPVVERGILAIVREGQHLARLGCEIRVARPKQASEQSALKKPAKSAVTG